MKDISEQQGRRLVDLFKGRRPLYGTVAVATKDVRVELVIEA